MHNFQFPFSATKTSFPRLYFQRYDELNFSYTQASYALYHSNFILRRALWILNFNSMSTHILLQRWTFTSIDIHSLSPTHPSRSSMITDVLNQWIKIADNVIASFLSLAAENTQAIPRYSIRWVESFQRLEDFRFSICHVRVILGRLILLILKVNEMEWKGKYLLK